MMRDQALLQFFCGFDFSRTSERCVTLARVVEREP